MIQVILLIQTVLDFLYYLYFQQARVVLQIHLALLVLKVQCCLTAPEARQVLMVLVNPMVQVVPVIQIVR